MASKPTHCEDRAELLAVLATMSVGRGSHEQRLIRMHRVMLHNGDAMAEATLPSGQKRAALTDAMMEAQTIAGRKRAACILCGHPVERDVPKGHPATPNLITLIPSVLMADDEIVGTDRATAHRLGFVPGNVAVACLTCTEWKTTEVRAGRAPILSADVLGDMAALVLLSWDGIGNVTRSDENPEWDESRNRRNNARAGRLAYMTAPVKG